MLRQIEWVQGKKQPQDLELIGSVAFSVGEIGYVTSTGQLAKAIATGTGTLPGLFASVNGCGAAGSGGFRPWGIVVNNDWSWTPGAWLYVSTSTAGALTASAPTTYINPVAQAMSATAILLFPSFQQNYTPNTLPTDFSLAEGVDITVGTVTGSQIGTGATQKLVFFGGTPIVRPANTSDIKDALVALGLLTTGGATPLNTDGGAVTCGALTATSVVGTGDAAVTGHLTMSDAKNIILNTGTGTKIGTASNQKFAFWNATPVTRQSLPAAAVTTNPVSTYDAGGYSAWGFSTSTQFTGLLTTVNSMRTILSNLGLAA